MKTYIYNGEKVFLAYMNDMPGVKPIDHCADVGCYPVSAHNGCSVCCTVDEAYTGELYDECEIIDTSCINPGDSQRLLDGWWTKHYAEIDSVTQELCVVTDKYYDWTSALTCFLRNMFNSREDDPVLFDAEKWQKKWDAICSEYTNRISEDNPCDMPDIPSVKDMLERYE